MNSKEIIVKQSGESINPFSKENFIGIKGYLAILIIIHHLYQFTAFLSDTSFGYALYLLGHYGVICFLFLSGFGLFSSYLSKGDAYIKTFLRNRLLPFYLSYIFFVIIYTIYGLINHSSISLNLILRSLTWGDTVVFFGWYFQTALLMYIMFFILKLVIKNDTAFVWGLGAAVLLFIFVYYFFISSQKNNYEPAFSFFLGVLFAYINGQKNTLFSKKPGIKTICGLAVFLLLASFSTLYNFRYNDYQWVASFSDFIYLLLMMITDFSLVFFLTAFISAVGRSVPGIISNPVSRFFGMHSMAIYGIQGLFLSFWINKIGNRPLYPVVAVSCIIIFSIPVHMFLTWLKKCIISRKPNQSC